MNTTDASVHAAEPFLRGLRTAVLFIATTVLLSFSILRNLDVYRPLWLQWAAFVALAVVLAVEAALYVGHRSWGRLRLPALGLVLAADVTAIASTPVDALASPANWAFGTVGWFGLIILLDRPLVQMVAFLGAHAAVVFGCALSARYPDASMTAALASGALGAIGYPLACAIAATALRQVATRAVDATNRAGELRTAGLLAAEIHRQRQVRLADLRQDVVPLLQRLADGVIDPAEPTTQRACAIAAARLRRLFAESDDVDDPLLHELEHCVQVAERRGVLVEWERRGSWPDLPVEIRRALTDGPLMALATAGSLARVTVVGAGGELSVSVVADCGSIDVPPPASPDVAVRVIPSGLMSWVEARWTK